MKFLNFRIKRDELFLRLGKGILKGTFTFIEGEEGSGKSVFVQRLAYGFLKNNYTVNYISAEETTSDFIKQMNSLNYPILDYLLTWKLKFFPVFPPTAKQRPTDLIEILAKVKKLYDSEIIIIDGFDLLLTKKTKEKSIFDLQNTIKKQISIGKNIFITYDPSKKLFVDEIENLKGIADNYVEAKTKITSGDIKHILLIKRWKSKDIAKKIISFRVEPGIGMILDITEYAI